MKKLILVFAVLMTVGLVAWGCEDPKTPVPPCSGNETWPDPCYPSVVGLDAGKADR